MIDVYRRAITPRTRVISMCHLVNTNGMILPVKAVSEMARARGILVAVDGAQAPGMINVDLHDLGCDFYAFSGHKAYGPAGIGATYTIPRYQEQHQLPFRNNLTGKTFHGHVCRLAEGNYACFFGWPNLSNTPLGGFLGLPGGKVSATMQVVDVYRRQCDKLAENWVFIDLPYWLRQQGLDILERTQKILNPE